MLAKNNGSRDINDWLEILSQRKGHQHDHFTLIILKIVTIFDSRLRYAHYTDSRIRKKFEIPKPSWPTKFDKEFIGA